MAKCPDEQYQQLEQGDLPAVSTGATTLSAALAGMPAGAGPALLLLR